MKNIFIEQYGMDNYTRLKANNDQLYRYCYYANDYKIVDKLLTLNNTETFWDNVRKFTKKVYSDRSIGRWQALAELRYLQIEN